MNLDAKEYLARANQAKTQMGCGQGDVTVLQMDKRIYLIIGDVSVRCDGGCSPGQQLSIQAAVRV